MDILNPAAKFITAAKLIGVGLLLAALAWKIFEVNALTEWRDEVVTSAAFATDDQLGDDKLPKVAARDVPQILRNFGTAKREAMRLREKARADDSQNIIRVDNTVDANNEEQLHAYRNRIAELNRNLNSLRAERLLRGDSAAIGNAGGRGDTDLPAVPAAAIRTAGPPEEDELLAGTDWSLDERYEASLYATQLDQLISSVEELAAIDPNATQPVAGKKEGAVE